MKRYSGADVPLPVGKIFYFQPGHEEYPIYYHPQIQRIITNAVKWAKPVNKRSEHYDNVEVK